MARAKRTDRSEARRQYRVYLAQQQEARAAAEAAAAGADQDEEAPVGRRPAAGTGRGSQPARPLQPGERLGPIAAARAAFLRPNYMDDLRNIGPLIVRTNAVWPVAAVCVVAAAVSIPRIHSNADLTNDPILSIIFQFVLWPLPLLPPMLAGFLAPRATWMAGLLAALISVVTLLFVLSVTPVTVVAGVIQGPSPAPSAIASVPAASENPSVGLASPTPAATGQPSSSATPAGNPTVYGKVDLGSAAISWLPGALAFGALIGAGAGWYKRFLELMSPRQNRSKPGQKRPVRKTPGGRR